MGIRKHIGTPLVSSSNIEIFSDPLMTGIRSNSEIAQIAEVYDTVITPLLASVVKKDARIAMHRRFFECVAQLLLNNGQLHRKFYLPYALATRYARPFGFTQDTYFSTLQSDRSAWFMPWNLHTQYTGYGWVSYPQFFGTASNRLAKSTETYASTLKFIQSLRKPFQQGVLRRDELVELISTSSNLSDILGTDKKIMELLASYIDSDKSDTDLLQSLVGLRNSVGLEVGDSGLTTSVDESEDDEDEDLVGTVLEASDYTHDQGPDLRSFIQGITAVDKLVEINEGELSADSLEFLISKRVLEVHSAIAAAGGDFSSAIMELLSLRNNYDGPWAKEILLRAQAEINAVASIQVPGFSGKMASGKMFTPNWMQRYTCFRLSRERRTINYSSGGEGKEFAALAAAHYIGAKKVAYIANNGTVMQIQRNIRAFFPATHVMDAESLDANSKADCQFAVLNYEKFQIDRRQAIITSLLDWGVDFIVCDEIQNLKHRGGEDASRRHEAVQSLVEEATDRIPNLYVLGMTATPAQNDIHEALSLVRLVSGKHVTMPKGAERLRDAHTARKLLIKHGFNISGVPPVKVMWNSNRIDGEPFRKELVPISRNGCNTTAKAMVLTRAKMDCLTALCPPETPQDSAKLVVYTEYRKEVVNYLATELTRRTGLRVGLYVGMAEDTYPGDMKQQQRQDALTRFQSDGSNSDALDILIVSPAGAEGLDGLQRVCNRIVFASLPYTWARQQQVVWRIARQGSPFPLVRVHQLEVAVENRDGKFWSDDQRRLKIISHKKNLLEYITTGNLNPEKPSEFINKAERALDLCEEVAEHNGLVSPDYMPKGDKLPIAFNQALTTRLNARDTKFKLWFTRLRDTSMRDAQKRSRWLEFTSAEAWDRINCTTQPAQRIAEKLKANHGWRVADLGCGDGTLAKILGERVDEYDFSNADRPEITVSSLDTVPVSDATYHSCVISLSLWGRHWEKIITEAHRITKKGGRIYIAERPDRWRAEWERNFSDLKKAIEGAGLSIASTEEDDGFVYYNCVKI